MSILPTRRERIFANLVLLVVLTGLALSVLAGIEPAATTSVVASDLVG